MPAPPPGSRRRRRSSSSSNNKRKANATDSLDSHEAAIYDELGRKLVDDVADAASVSDPDNDDLQDRIQDSGDESVFDDDDDDDDAEDVDSDQYTSAEDDDEDDKNGYALEAEGVYPAATSPKFTTTATARKLTRSSSSPAAGLDDDDFAGRPPPPSQVTTDANGNLRFIYPEIDPVYDSDDSDAPATNNTIGNIPLSYYDAYPHIGYDIDGKKIQRPAKGKALDSLLDSIDIPKGWTGLTDPETGKPLQLNADELDTLKRLTRNENVEDGYDPYPDMVEYFSGRLETMPLSAAPEPKRRFVPSKHEAKRVMKIVRAIKEGRIQPYKPPSDEAEEDFSVPSHDLWADEAPRIDHPMHVPAPKLPPPGYDESYHPPPEYLPNEEERRQWEEQDPEDRTKEYLPKDHDALRKVAGYTRFINERFERSLDLYLAPRVRRSKLNIDPDSLLPKLPSPDELRPYPHRCDIVFSGHKGHVRSIAVDPRGLLLASGGDDGFLRIWTIESGRQVFSVRLSDQEAVSVVSWRPTTDAFILAAAAGERVFLIAPDLLYFASAEDDIPKHSRDILNAGWTFPKPADSANVASSITRTPSAKWALPEARLQDKGVLVQVTLRSAIKVISWHRRGEYFSTVSPAGQSNSVAIHTLSKHLTQLPFRRLKGLAQSVQFHPNKPIFLVATQRSIRAYDLARQELLKIMQPGAKWISSFDVHPGGDNLIVGSYDKRLLWMDMDLSSRAYKTLRYHTKAIRSVAYHKGGYPLFADASDDASLQVFHGKVVSDLMQGASIVPLKVLRGHKPVSGLGVLDVAWCPREPWLLSAGADGTCRLWRS